MLFVRKKHNPCATSFPQILRSEKKVCLGLAKSMPENKDRKRKHDKVIGEIQASQTLQTQASTDSSLLGNSSFSSTTASAGQLEISPSPLFSPKPEFLQLLRSVGAEKELYSKKELFYYLKEYIGCNKLYDPLNPALVQCKNDQLGGVFGVEQFSISDVLGLLDKHSTPVNLQPKLSHSQAASTQQHNRLAHYREQYLNFPNQVPVNQEEASSKDKQEEKAQDKVDVKVTNHKKDKKSCTKTSTDKSSSESTDSKGNRRRCQSLSIIYSDAENDSYPWYFTLQVQKSDDSKSEILSIQSKETAVVRDSSDDFWFVDEDGFDVESDGEKFALEYEIDSDSSDTYVSLDTASVDSDSSQEGILLLCGDSDTEFWADYSDLSDSDDTDLDIADEDKWTCQECDMSNLPIQRYCQRCWKLRPGWLPESHHSKPPPSRTFRRSCSAPGDLPRSSTTMTSTSQPESDTATVINENSSTHVLSQQENRGEDTRPECCSSPLLLRPSSSPAAGERSLQGLPVGGSDSDSSCRSAKIARMESGDKKHVLQEMGMNIGKAGSLDYAMASPCRTDSGLSSLHSLTSSQEAICSALKTDTCRINNEEPDSVTCAADETGTSRFPQPHISGANDPVATVSSAKDERTPSSECVTTSNIPGDHVSESESLKGCQTRQDEDKAAVQFALPTASVRSYNKQAGDTSDQSSSSEKQSSKKSKKKKSKKGAPSASATADQSSSNVPYIDVCVVCLTNPKEASLIHGNSAHQVCCYSCAKKLRKHCRPCPVCRRPIEKVVKNFLV